MRVVEAAGRTVDEAVRDALKQLGVGRSDVDIEVVEEGSRGLFGLLGGRRARVRVELKPGVEPRTVTDDLMVEEVEKTSSTADKSGSQQSEDVSAIGDDGEVLEQKLEIARQFVAGVLERLEVEAALELRMDDDGMGYIHIVGDELGLVIGRRGQTLDALQFLTNQAANRQGGAWVRIVLDAGGYRERRAEALEALAARMADRAVRQGRKVALEPMNAFERRIIHMSLAEDDAVETESEGEDPYRRVVILPKRPSFRR